MKQIELSDIYAIFPRNPVLLPLVPGEKSQPHQRLARHHLGRYPETPLPGRLKISPSIGVLLGKNSSNLIFFDWDTASGNGVVLRKQPGIQEFVPGQRARWRDRTSRRVLHG